MSIVPGSKQKHRGCGNKRRLVDVEEKMVYVSILATLQQILKNDAVLAEVYVHCIQARTQDFQKGGSK